MGDRNYYGYIYPKEDPLERGDNLRNNFLTLLAKIVDIILDDVLQRL